MYNSNRAITTCFSSTVAEKFVLIRLAEKAGISQRALISKLIRAEAEKGDLWPPSDEELAAWYNPQDAI